MTLDLSIPAGDYLAHYQGLVAEVVATSREGLRVRFPSRLLQPFVTHTGIHGCFVLRFDANNQFVGIEKIA